MQSKRRTTTLTAGDLEFHFFIPAAQPTLFGLNTRASGKWCMVYSANWTPLTLMAAESDDGLDWQPLACPDIQPMGEKLAPHHIFTLPGGSGGGVYLDPEAVPGLPTYCKRCRKGTVRCSIIRRSYSSAMPETRTA